MRNHRANLRDQKLYNFRRTRRNLSSTNVNRTGFQLDCNTDYCLHIGVRIGPMDVVCEYCGALKFSGETPGLCCLIGKVKLSLLTPPLELLNSLLCGKKPELQNFLAITQKHNSCFQNDLIWSRLYLYHCIGVERPKIMVKLSQQK